MFKESRYFISFEKKINNELNEWKYKIHHYVKNWMTILAKSFFLQTSARGITQWYVQKNSSAESDIHPPPHFAFSFLHDYLTPSLSRSHKLQKFHSIRMLWQDVILYVSTAITNYLTSPGLSHQQQIIIPSVYFSVWTGDQ